MMMGFGFLVMLLFWGLFLALIVGGVVFLVRQTNQTRPPGTGGDRTALRILDERLARGEISRDEYEALRAALQQ